MQLDNEFEFVALECAQRGTLLGSISPDTLVEQARRKVSLAEDPHGPDSCECDPRAVTA